MHDNERGRANDFAHFRSALAEPRDRYHRVAPPPLQPRSYWIELLQPLFHLAGATDLEVAIVASVAGGVPTDDLIIAMVDELERTERMAHYGINDLPA